MTSPSAPEESTPGRREAMTTVLWRWGLDRATVFGILARVWGVASGAVTTLLIATWFTPVLQGYYYTFSNLLALQVFLELGLGTVIIQFAAHEWSGLSRGESGRIAGDPNAHSRLASLARLALVWYGIAGILTTLGLGIGGYVFFARSPHAGVDWVLPWVVLSVVTGINLLMIPLWMLLEGCNQLKEVYLFRLTQSVVSGVVVWGCILVGLGLWTMPIALVATVTWGAWFLWSRYRGFFESLSAPPPGPAIQWREELWPLQWKIALSWAAGYFINSLFTPVLFKARGPVEAGQMGMTLTLVSAVSGVAYTWVATKVPRFGVLIARRQWADLDRLFVRSGLLSMALVTAGGLALWSGVWALYALHLPIAHRLLPPLATGLLVLAMVLNSVVAILASYLRAHKQEPYLITSVLGGILIGTSTVLFGQWFGALGQAAGQCASVLLLLGPNVWIFLQCRREWHADSPDRGGGAG